MQPLPKDPVKPMTKVFAEVAICACECELGHVDFTLSTNLDQYPGELCRGSHCPFVRRTGRKALMYTWRKDDSHGLAIRRRPPIQRTAGRSRGHFAAEYPHSIIEGDRAENLVAETCTVKKHSAATAIARAYSAAPETIWVADTPPSVGA